MPNSNRSDHDLLIQIDTKLNVLAQTVSEFNPRLATKAEIADMKRIEVDVAHNTDNIEALERFKWMLLGSVGALQVFGELFFHVLLRK